MFYINICINIHTFAGMNKKNNRLDTLKMLISSKELRSQEEVLRELEKAGYHLTQATLSRDLKQLKVAKAASGGRYMYVLPNETMYKRNYKDADVRQMMELPGYVSLNFSGNLAVIKTRPGFASLIAYNIDNAKLPSLLGTVAGDDTIIMVVKEGVSHEEVTNELREVVKLT